MNLQQLRAAFWRAHPWAPRKTVQDYSGRGRMYPTDTRVLWCDFVDSMARSGQISEALARQATLSERKMS